MNMKWIGILAVAATAVLGGACSARASDELRGLKPGEKLPEFELATVKGGTVGNQQWQDRVLVLVYLSAEQRNSERAAVDAERIVDGLEGRPVTLVFVTADVVYRSYFEKYFAEAELSSELALDGQRLLYSRLGLFVFPTTLVVDAEGRLSHVLSTRGTDYPHVLESYVLHALGDLSNDELKEKLTARSFDRGSPKSLAARHRAAARLLREKGLLDGAEQELRSALKLDGESVHTRLDLADLCLILGRTEECERIVDQVLGVDPRHRRARSLKGIVLFKKGKLDEAEAILTEALELNADPARTHYYLGQVYEQQGDQKKAIQQYRMAISRLLKEDG